MPLPLLRGGHYRGVRIRVNVYGLSVGTENGHCREVAGSGGLTVHMYTIQNMRIIMYINISFDIFRCMSLLCNCLGSKSVNPVFTQ